MGSELYLRVSRTIKISPVLCELDSDSSRLLSPMPSGPCITCTPLGGTILLLVRQGSLDQRPLLVREGPSHRLPGQQRKGELAHVMG